MPRPLYLSSWLLIGALALTALLLPLMLLSSAHTPRVPPALRTPTRLPERPPAPSPSTTETPPPADTAPATAAAPPVPTSDPAPLAATAAEAISAHHRAPGDPFAPRAAGLPVTTTRPAGPDRSPEARRERVARFGGNANTEDAVEAGLSWLAAHQSPDGRWDRRAHGRLCPPDDVCPGPAIRRERDDLAAGIQGLCLLAFTGAGYTHQAGRHRQVVARGLQALLAEQQPHGGFSATDSMAGYNDAVATFALAELLALTRDQRLRTPLERAVARLAATQQARGGWDYLPDPRSGRNDTSITGWAVQALQAAAAAGVDVPRATLIRAALHFTRASAPDGRVWYADAGTGTAVDDNSQVAYRYGAAMTAVGLVGGQLLGWRADSPLRLKQQALLFSEPPAAAMARGKDPDQLHSEYYWYYGTVALFQVGGEAWQRWNSRLRDALLPLQDRQKNADGERRHTYGSWPPYGPNWGRWGRMGGRIYTTALGTLTLEIYYRHTPAFLDDALVYTAEDWIAYLHGADVPTRHDALRCLRHMRLEVGEPVLLALLADEAREVALGAAEELAGIDSPAGRALLEQGAASAPVWERQRYERALARLRASETVATAGTLRMYDAPSRLATLELPRSYVGQVLTVRRGEHVLGQFRVIQRFSGRTVCLAEWLGSAEPAPAAGDEVGR